MKKMVEPPPFEGDEGTITAMSPLAVVGQYLSTNSANSMFLRNTGLVVFLRPLGLRLYRTYSGEPM